MTAPNWKELCREADEKEAQQQQQHEQHEQHDHDHDQERNDQNQQRQDRHRTGIVVEGSNDGINPSGNNNNNNNSNEKVIKSVLKKTKATEEDDVADYDGDRKRSSVSFTSNENQTRGKTVRIREEANETFDNFYYVDVFLPTTNCVCW